MRDGSKKLTLWNIKYQDKDGKRVVEQIWGDPSEIKLILDRFLEQDIDVTAEVSKFPT
jgi:hypothetical protein